MLDREENKKYFDEKLTQIITHAAKIETTLGHMDKSLSDHILIDDNKNDAFQKKLEDIQKFMWMLLGALIILNILFGKLQVKLF